MIVGQHVSPLLIVQLARAFGKHSEAAKALAEFIRSADSGDMPGFFLIPDSERIVVARRV